VDEMVEQRVTQEVAKALGEQRDFYQQANQTLFKEYAQALSTQQQQSSAELTKYLLASSREERKHDFAELIKFINEQRIDDQRFYARQFTRLQDEIDDIEIGYSAVNLPKSRSEVPLAMPYETNNPQSSLDD
jgi:RNA polymerase-interacting CarD/CdnL/TRCF family regulator